MNATQVREMVRDAYGKVASEKTSCCGPSSACSGSGAGEAALRYGYTSDDLAKAPAESNLGLGCGNPISQARLQPGEVVVDLGSGAGFDSFLAAREVGRDGQVIGVDMTSQMLSLARQNAEKSGAENVEFRQGFIESLPLGDQIADVVLSNCVVNLSPDKPAVFREAFRVLKDGGRLVVSDIVLDGALPAAVLESLSAYAGCVAGAAQLTDYLDAIAKAGFEEVEVLEAGGYDADAAGEDPFAREVAAQVGEAAVRRAVQVVRRVVVRGVRPAEG